MGAGVPSAVRAHPSCWCLGRRGRLLLVCLVWSGFFGGFCLAVVFLVGFAWFGVLFCWVLRGFAWFGIAFLVGFAWFGVEEGET